MNKKGERQHVKYKIKYSLSPRVHDALTMFPPLPPNLNISVI